MSPGKGLGLEEGLECVGEIGFGCRKEWASFVSKAVDISLVGGRDLILGVQEDMGVAEVFRNKDTALCVRFDSFGFDLAAYALSEFVVSCEDPFLILEGVASNDA